MFGQSLILLAGLGGGAVTGVAGASGTDLERPQDDLAGIESRLGSPDAEERRRATGELARLASPAALERLLAMLADAEAMVADEAQLAVGAWPRPEDAPRILAGLEDRRGAVTERVAEALGRLPFPLEADALAIAVRSRDPRVRSLVCFSIERLARARRIGGDPAARLVGALEALLREREVRPRADALLALAALDPVRAPALARGAAADGAPELRAAAAIVAGALPEEPGLPLAAELVADGAGAVRVRAAQSLARLGTPGAARVLAARLGVEAEPRVVRELLERLRGLSGLRHGADPRPWLEWAEGLAEDWRAPAPGAGAARAGTSEGATVSFAGLPVRSDRVAFLIDLSGSIWIEREGGGTRKQALDGELLRTLESLPPRASFNIIAFTHATWPWRKGLVQANERSVRDAIRSFQGQRHRGHGDYWGALLLALADPEVDTVIFFGDGRPSGGARWNLELMRVLLEHENRYRAVVVDAVLVDLSRRIERLWDALTADTGGTYVEVSL